MPICTACGGCQAHTNSCRYRMPLPINANPSQRYAYNKNKDMFKKDPNKKK